MGGRGRGPTMCLSGVVIVALALLACARDRDADTTAERADTTTARESRDSVAPSMADGAILDVALTANTMGVQIAELARFRAQNSDVRRFAQTMVPDHSAVNGELQALAGRAGLSPIIDQQSNVLRAEANKEYAALDSLYGPAFDRAYIEREVEYHEALVELFDDTLVPAAQRRELKTLLERVRPMLAAHLERARQIRAASTASAR